MEVYRDIQIFSIALNLKKLIRNVFVQTLQNLLSPGTCLSKLYRTFCPLEHVCPNSTEPFVPWNVFVQIL